MGNILGATGCTGVVEQIPYRSTYRNPVIWKIGFGCCSATGNPPDPKSAATLIRHGNYDYITKGLTWNSTIPDHNIPDSLYRSAKPAWFKTLPWPAFTPERAGFNPSSLNKFRLRSVTKTGPSSGFRLILSNIIIDRSPGSPGGEDADPEGVFAAVRPKGESPAS